MVRITIRCAKCYNTETQDVEAWGSVRTTCGCNGPYRVLSRERLPDALRAEAKGTKGAKGPKVSAAPAATNAPEPTSAAAVEPAPPPASDPAPAPEPAGTPENQDSAG